MRITATCLAILAMGLPHPAPAQTATRPEILILGTYHMRGSGNHVFNTEVDDILSERRQAEIEELIDVLQRFRPTKIAVEAQVGSRRIADAYSAYLAGTYALTGNEIDQIGFRLAKELGHDFVHPVDEDGDFPFYRVQNYAIANGMEAAWDSIQASGAAKAERASEFMRTHTVLEILEYMNADSTSASGVADYYSSYLPYGEPYEYAGPDLIASWFRRNIRIYHNVRALVTSPNDRILVVYGAGHLGWLQQMAEDDPGVELRRLGEVIGGD